MSTCIARRNPGAWKPRVLAALLAAAAAAAGFAGNRDFWRFETSEDFLAGESEGVSIGPEGQVRLAPALRALHESEQPFVWSLAPDGSGGVVAGGGAQGTLIRVRDGAAEVLADTGEAGIHAVAVGPDGAVYFATAPGGSVQRILPGGERGVFFQPEARYIWAIVPEPGGSILVATGMPASVIRIQPSGSAETVFTTSEENVTALHRATDGTIHLGTEPSGIVFRIDAASGAMALYDSPLAEIRALAVNAAGEVFAAAVADTGRGAATGGGAVPPPPETSSPAAGVVATTSFRVLAGAAPASAPGPAAAAANGTAGALYRIAPTGAARTIWRSATDRPLSLAMLRDERLLLGTGDRGRVYRVTRDGDVTLLFRADSEQVTAAVSEGGVTLLGASNPGRVLELSASPRTEGSYLSRVLDAGGAAHFGRISWDTRTPPGSAVSVETRTGKLGRTRRHLEQLDGGHRGHGRSQPRRALFPVAGDAAVGRELLTGDGLSRSCLSPGQPRSPGNRNHPPPSRDCVRGNAQQFVPPSSGNGEPAGADRCRQAGTIGLFLPRRERTPALPARSAHRQLPGRGSER